MSRDVRPTKGLVQVLPGHLHGGCTFPFAHAAVLSSRRHGTEEGAAEAKKRKKNKNALSSLSDIRPGDYVVHQNNGIGMYAGIQRLEVQGATKDYLKDPVCRGGRAVCAGDPAGSAEPLHRPRRREQGQAGQAGRRRVEAHPGQGQKSHRGHGPGADRAVRPPPPGHWLRLPP